MATRMGVLPVFVLHSASNSASPCAGRDRTGGWRVVTGLVFSPGDLMAVLSLLALKSTVSRFVRQFRPFRSDGMAIAAIGETV